MIDRYVQVCALTLFFEMIDDAMHVTLRSKEDNPSMELWLFSLHNNILRKMSVFCAASVHSLYLLAIVGSQEKLGNGCGYNGCRN